ncbi:MAG: NAD-dependent epimerase/dehydratase family protein [Syntrophaceae bacterium]|nr:NAD-dependent epimerase/dehydratase family protein [Syntrophaceae bacterium]
MKALVLGGNGFIGSHVVDSLLDAGHSIRVFDRFPERFRPPLANVEYVTGLFGDAFSIAEALTGVDVVYHLIGTTVPGTSNLNPTTDIEDNLIASVSLLEEMVKTGVKRIVYLSSGGTVYGNPERNPTTEDHPLRPICSYGVVKVAVENYLFMFQQLYGISAVVLRPSNPYGPRQGHVGVQGVISTFLKKLLKNEPLLVWGDGSITRDYLYVADLARICLIAGESEISGVFNVGHGKGYSISTIIETISKVVGEKPVVRHEPARHFDVREIVLDITKVRKYFGWNPEINLDDGIKTQWEWMNQNVTS